DAAFVGNRDLLDGPHSCITLTDRKGHAVTGRVERSCIEEHGPVRATVRLDGVFVGAAPCRFVARLCFFAGLGLVRLRVTLHNPRRARHRGGLWDLGDAGSVLFRDLSLAVVLAPTDAARLTWRA